MGEYATLCELERSGRLYEAPRTTFGGATKSRLAAVSVHMRGRARRATARYG